MAGQFGGYLGAVGDPSSTANQLTSGAVQSGTIGDNAVHSGDISSGAVLGALGGGYRVIASGTVGPFDLGSGSILSGAIASGQIGTNHLASGSVLSGAVASGQIGQNHLASGAVLSGTIASGQIGPNHLASGIYAGVVRVWAKVNSSGGNTGILATNGVASIQRIGAGQYRVIFQNNFPSAHYYASVNAGVITNPSIQGIIYDPVNLQTVSGFDVRTGSAADGSLFDPPMLYVEAIAAG